MRRDGQRTLRRGMRTSSGERILGPEREGEACLRIPSCHRLDGPGDAAVRSGPTCSDECEFFGVEVDWAGGENRAADQLIGRVTKAVMVEFVKARDYRRPCGLCVFSACVHLQCEQRL